MLLYYYCIVVLSPVVCNGLYCRLVSKDARDTYVRITGLPYAMGKMDQILGIKVYHYYFEEVA